MFLNIGFKTVTMDDIAQEMSISKKTLYQYFDGKDSLVAETLNEISRQVFHCIDEIRTQKLNPIEELFEFNQIIDRIIPIDQQSNTVFQLNKYYSNIFKTFQEKQCNSIEEKVIENLIRGQKEGYYFALNEQLYARFYYMGMISSKQEHIVQGFVPKEMREEFLQMFLKGIVNKKGRYYLEDKLKINAI